MAVSLFLYFFLWADGQGFAFRQAQTVHVQLGHQFLNDPKIIKNFESGLTTTIEVLARVHDGSKYEERGFLLEWRFELWDELFLGRLLTDAGPHQNYKINDLPELKAWFTKQRFSLGTFSLDPEKDWIVDVKLRVIPFSEKEKSETLNWFNQGIGSAGSRGDVGRGV